MSDAKLIGSGILYTDDVNDEGPLAELLTWPSGFEPTFTLARDRHSGFNITRGEVRDLLPMLTAFANGAP